MRRIVIEYDVVVRHNDVMAKSMKQPVFKRIISWVNQDGKMTWKEIKCPQKSFYGMKGHWEFQSYFTIGLQMNGIKIFQIDEPLDNKTDNEGLCSS